MLLDLKKISRVFFIVYVVFLPQYSFAAVGNEMLIDNKVNPVVFFVDRVDETREILQKLQFHKIVRCEMC